MARAERLRTSVAGALTRAMAISFESTRFIIVTFSALFSTDGLRVSRAVDDANRLDPVVIVLRFLGAAMRR
jgi:hypothetical protein